MKLFKRIVSCFLTFSILISLINVSAHAAASDSFSSFGTSKFWEWLVSNTRLDNSVGITDYFNSIFSTKDSGCTSSSGYHLWRLASDLPVGTITNSFVVQCAYCGAYYSDYTSESTPSDVYSSYVSTLPAPEVTYEGELTVPCFHVQFFTSGSGTGRYCGHSIDANDNLTFSPDSYDKDKFSFNCSNSSVTFLEDFSGSVNIVWAFIPPAAGTYSNVWPVVSSGTAWKYPVTITEDQVGKVYVVGGTASISVSRDSGSTVVLSPCYMLYEAPPVDFEEDEQYSYSSRPAYLTQQIYNYNNSGNSTTKYGIGTVDNSGNITNVYDINIFNEETMVFTEPVTGAQYICTGWTYNYETRTYQLALASGTFSIGDYWITRVDITYGDEELTISYWSGSRHIRTDTYAYVIATPEECQHEYTSEITIEPTCTEPGEMTYTCTLCGNTYTEEIPALGHDWKLVETVPAVKDEDGNVLEYAYTLYECSRCKEQYMDYDSTGPPADDGTSCSSYWEWWKEAWNNFVTALFSFLGIEIDPDAEPDAPESTVGFWERIKNAFLDALATLIEKVLGFITEVLGAILDLVYDLLSFFFDFLTGTVISGISGFFSSFTDGSLFQFFQSEDGTGYALPEGVASVFAFFSAIFLCLPADLRYVLMFGIGLIIFLAVFKLVKS